MDLTGCYICSKHFKPEMFKIDMRAKLMNLPSRRELVAGAMPELNLPCFPNLSHPEGTLRKESEKIKVEQEVRFRVVLCSCSILFLQIFVNLWNIRRKFPQGDSFNVDSELEFYFVYLGGGMDCATASYAKSRGFQEHKFGHFSLFLNILIVNISFNVIFPGSQAYRLWKALKIYGRKRPRQRSTISTNHSQKCTFRWTDN